MMSSPRPVRVPLQVLVHPVRRTSAGWEYLMLWLRAARDRDAGY